MIHCVEPFHLGVLLSSRMKYPDRLRIPGSCFGSFPFRAPSRLELIPPKFPESKSPGDHFPTSIPLFHSITSPSRVNGPLPGRYLRLIPSVERTIHPFSGRTKTSGEVQSRFWTTAVSESTNDLDGEYSSRTSVGERILILAFPEMIPPGMVS